MASPTAPSIPEPPPDNVPGDDDARDASQLSPVRAHYLKKTLIQLEFRNELRAITSGTPNNVSTLSYLGAPFSPPLKDAPRLDLPLLRYIFRQFVLTFPFLASAPKDFFPEKVQPFVASVVSRNLTASSGMDDSSSDSEQGGPAKLLTKLERNFALFINYALKITETEEVVRLKQADLDRLEFLAKKRQARLLKMRDVFEVNVICVRSVTERGRVRSRVHQEFIVRTRRSRYPDVFVSRRYGDFKTLAEELRKAHPEELTRPPPPKDRSYGNAPVSTPLTPTASRASEVNYSTDSLPMSPSTASQASGRLVREKNRLTLRAYLHSLLSSPTIASSPVLQSFLLSGPTQLSPEEVEDAQRREEIDRVRDEGRKQFAKEVATRVDSLRDTIKGVKGEIMGKDGLTHLFGIIKTTPNVRDLPPDFQGALEWARISMASTVFHHFVAADDASETLAGLKRIHSLMPYFMLKAALKISNPVSMIRTVLDLFLAQPFGGRSLLQRMFTSSLNEEVKALEEDIEAVKDKVDDPLICEKIRQFVYAPKEIQAIYRADAFAEDLHLLAAVLRSGEEPCLSRAQMQRVARSHRAHKAYMAYRETLADSDDDDGPPTEEAWFFEDLSLLSSLFARLRDKEQLIALIFEGTTADLLKDIITIFYSPLAQVYRAASIADSLSDFQNFINDLIRTVESVEELSQEDPHRTVQLFIDLIQRHEQSFYHFVHKVHSKGESLFTGLMRWIELFLTVVREGLGEAISLEFLLPHKGEERKAILDEIDAVALYHYKLKIAYESKIRRRFASNQAGDAAADEEATLALVQGVVHDFSINDIMKGDAEDLAAEDSDDTYGSSSEYEYVTDDSSDSYTEESSDRRSIAHSLSNSKLPDPPHTALPIVRPPPSPTLSTTSKAPSQRSTRPRLLSLPLRRTRSMSMTSNGGPSRSSAGVPPVPPLPKDIPMSARFKPLPPSPALPPSPRRESSDRKQKRYSAQDLPSRTSPKQKKSADMLLPPDLKYTPNLLPVFLEMLQPQLQPRTA
ncbi:hypothetical protein EVG20_g7258 [Dentipellis fragilis]|uniref:PX domain-containing protein n=1 Tax=Dentipellis fragilis TaxID=205917 RepID=A0A4Y9YG98_9AGAM|nr:hypothetical protein EVG20_g7258 [Dentipellis fragilis]